MTPQGSELTWGEGCPLLESGNLPTLSTVDMFQISHRICTVMALTRTLHLCQFCSLSGAESVEPTSPTWQLLGPGLWAGYEISEF